MKDQEAGDFEKAQAEWKEIASMYEGDIQDCAEALDTYNAIKKYETEVLARSDAKEYIKKMIEKNKEWVDGAEAGKLEQWKAGNYFVAGKFAAMAAQYMGIAPPNGQLEVRSQTKSDRDPYAPAQFTAGWYYGIAGKDKRDKIVECFKPNDKLTNFLYEAFDEYIAGNKMAGDAYLAKTKPLYRRALSDCGNL